MVVFALKNESETRGNSEPSLGIYYGFCYPPSKTVDKYYAEWDWISLKYYLQNLSRDILQHNRIDACMRVINPGKQTVDLHRSDDGEQVHYRNLARCLNVWGCPVCASTITAKRRQELAANLYKTGFYWTFVTFTLRHDVSMALKPMLGAILSAYRALSTGAASDRLRDRFSLAGTVKSLEVTYGVNGWHPHIHVLYASRSPIDTQEFWAALAPRWQTMLEKRGYDATRYRGTDVRETNDAVSEYIAKYGHMPKDVSWSPEHEMTRAPVKRGKRGGMSAFEILMCAGCYDLPDSDWMFARSLWNEYFEAFSGRHQLQVSRILKKIFDHQLSDAEICENEGDEYPLFAQLSIDDWRSIVRHRARAKVLQAARAGDSKAFWSVVNDTKTSNPHDGNEVAG